jgi:hypothetical protein
MSRLRRVVLSDHWFFIAGIHEYTGNITDTPAAPNGLSVDRVLLPADPRTRI